MKPSIKHRERARRRRVLTDARRNMRSALLVASGASVASSTGYTVFAGTLAGALVTGLSRSPDRVTVARCNPTNRSLSGGNDRELVKILELFYFSTFCVFRRSSLQEYSI